MVIILIIFCIAYFATNGVKIMIKAGKIRFMIGDIFGGISKINTNFSFSVLVNKNSRFSIFCNIGTEFALLRELRNFCKLQDFIVERLWGSRAVFVGNAIFIKRRIVVIGTIFLPGIVCLAL